MAPSYANADNAYRNAVARLSTSVMFLERHLPTTDNAEVTEPEGMPPLKPSRPRLESVPACAQCQAELEELDAGSRDSHVCTHHTDEVDNSANLTTRSDASISKSRGKGQRQRQPNTGVVRQDMNNMNEKFEAFTSALATFCTVMEDEEEIRMFEEHLLVWTEYVGWMRDRAEDLIALIEGAQQPIQTLQPVVPQPLGDQGNQVREDVLDTMD